MEIIKKAYIAPAIETISIDNEISLVLQSIPPDGPGEIGMINADCFNNNPFHCDNA